MKSKKHLLSIALLAIIMLVAFSATALADDFEIPPFPQVPGEENTTMEYVASFLMQTAGLKEANLGTYPRDHIAMAKSIGLFEGVEFVEGAECGIDDYLRMANNVIPLFNALRLDPPEPFFVDGMAQPIFPYGSSTYFDTSGEGVARFVVYVETNYDTDYDGKLDLIKVMVQLPRACVDKGMKVSTIYHAQPYNEGTNGSGVSYPAALQPEGNAWLAENGPLTHDLLHKAAPARIPVGEATTKEMVENADWRDWRYRYTYNSSTLDATVEWGVANGNQVSSLNMHDYFVVRGYALVSSAGLATVGGDGLASCGADIEVDAYKCVIDWLNGRAKAYTDKTSNIEVKADWSNGKVGMTGTSYGGTTTFALATSGVEGLETVIPVAAIASWYEYQNQQGVVNSSAGYTPGLVWYILSRIGTPDWAAGSAFRGRQIGYMQQMLQEATALTGNYGDHWARRDYTVDGWFKDWGPSKIKIPILLVHGGNDNNVRPKQSILMYQAAKKAGVDVKFMWDQGHHMTPNNHQIGDYVYQEWQNLWYSHFLYQVDNNVLELMPDFSAQSNLTGDYISYDSFETDHKLILGNKNRVVASPFTPFSVSQQKYEEPEEYNGVDYFLLGGDNGEEDAGSLAPEESEAENSAGADTPAPLAVSFAAAEDQFTTINSANGSSGWQNFLDAPTAASTLYDLVLPYDTTVKGVVEIHFRAAIETFGSNLNTPIGHLRVHAKLVEIAKPGETLHYYGGNAVGDTISTDTIVSGGVYRGGGLSSSNLVKFRPTTTGTYRELARGWMNLAQPYSAYDSYTSHIDNRIDLGESIGVFHDYTLYLQPTVHTAKAGNRLALILTTGGASTAAYTGNNAYTFIIDNSATYTSIPLAAPLDTFTVTFLNEGKVYEEQTVEYSNWAKVPVEPEKEGYTFDGWFTEDGAKWDFTSGITSDITLYAKWIQEGTIIVNFPGIKGATMQYYTNISQWVTVGIFDDTCGFIIPEGHRATWGATTLRVVKDGMYHTFTVNYIGESVVLDVPLAAITVTGVVSACNLAVVQNDWVYRYAPAAVGEANGYLVFDNGKAYEVRLQKPGAAIVSIKGITAGQTVDISTYF